MFRHSIVIHSLHVTDPSQPRPIAAEIFEPLGWAGRSRAGPGRAEPDRVWPGRRSRTLSRSTNTHLVGLGCPRLGWAARGRAEPSPVATGRGEPQRPNTIKNHEHENEHEHDHGRSVGRSTYPPTDRLVGRSIYRPTDQPVSRSTGSLSVGRSVSRSVGQSFDPSTDRLAMPRCYAPYEMRGFVVFGILLPGGL